MAVFDLPRVNFSGMLRLNPGTANNEDYAQPGPGQALMPDGEPMGLLATGPVDVREFGMTDAEFVDWIQRPHVFATPSAVGQPPPPSPPIFPAEWNYYGDMSSMTLDVVVTGVQTRRGHVVVRDDPDEPLSAVLGATLSFNGVTTDINPEGSPPATQFFVDDVRLAKAGTSFLRGGSTSKGVGLWINFFRNVALQYDDGSGTYVQHVIRDCEVVPPGFEGADGVVMRYALSLPLLDDPTTDDPSVLRQYYRDRRSNPKTLDIVGTLAPYHAGEPIAMPPGRQLISRSQNISTPTKANNGGGQVALAPAVAAQHDGWLSIDVVGTFPEQHTGTGRDNPKYDFGDVGLYVVAGDDAVRVGTLPYADTVAGDQCGWIFDFDLTDPAAGRAAELLATGDGVLELRSASFDTVLREVEYYVVTDQLAAYAEQHGDGGLFVSQGSAEPVTIGVYHRGARLSPDECPPVSMWQYRSTPIQDPGTAMLRTSALPIDEPIDVSTADACTYLLTFLVEGETNPPAPLFPPASYADFAYPPEFAVTWAPQISIRVLPNTDYSRYFVDPDADEPVGNEALTWELVYDEVLRTYALLYPAMNNKFRLDDPVAMTEFAAYVIAATDPDRWHSTRYMPPTRDLSASRRRLLQAWCRKRLDEVHAEASASGDAGGPDAGGRPT